MIKVKYINREDKNVRSSGDSRKMVDAYCVIFECPPDNDYNETYEWACRFEVPRGSKFQANNFASKKEAVSQSGYKI